MPVSGNAVGDEIGSSGSSSFTNVGVGVKSGCDVDVGEGIRVSGGGLDGVGSAVRVGTGDAVFV